MVVPAHPAATKGEVRPRGIPSSEHLNRLGSLVVGEAHLREAGIVFEHGGINILRNAYKHT